MNNQQQYAISTNEQDFHDHVLAARGVVLTYWWADWCGPCKEFKPVLYDFVASFGDEVALCTIDADAAVALTREYNVRSLPTLIVFVNGEQQQRLSGVVSKSRIFALVDEFIEE
ncbi:thioredoxin family protein [Carnimonas bestiolae]|uniref:thioredoxin family protein n=1 Tax=Carnimonas bestiolae TaxID=3402172 RepID=UPI003EDB87ED